MLRPLLALLLVLFGPVSLAWLSGTRLPARSALAAEQAASDATTTDVAPTGLPEPSGGINDASSNDARSQASDASPQSASEPATAPASQSGSTEGASGWMQRVDAFFGRFLVTPLVTVLFYDFGTPRWLGTSVPLVVVWLLGGAIFFTLRMRFINIRGFRHAVQLTRGDFDRPEEAGEVSHFQALASALSATVGLGNIAGVAIAVATGGPGAIFWLIVVGLLGMSSKFTECSLGQMYRKIDLDGRVSGGPMHYLADGLREMRLGPLGVVLATLFTIMCIGGSFGGGCAFQVGQSLGVVRGQFPVLDRHPYIYGIVMVVLVGVVIIGGIRRIAATAEKIVPAMCGIYVLAALYIIFSNYREIPHAALLIVQSAITPEAAYGGFWGVMVTGIKRAAFSNEAGIGSASIAHSAAKTDEPISEGIVALLEPFIDTVVVCTMTGLVIVITGAYDQSRFPEFAQYIASDRGAALTSEAFRQSVSWFPWILTVAVVLFAYSTMISWSYYGERCWTHLFGPRSSTAYKIIFLVFVFLGSIITAKNVLTFSDLMILSMAFPNILGVALLSGKVRRRLDDYWHRLKSGELRPQRDAANAPT